MTISIEHTVKFVTDFDEEKTPLDILEELKTKPAQYLENLLAQMATALIAESNILTDLNKNNTYAILKLVKV